MMAHASRTMPIKEVENVREFLKTELLDIQKFFIVGVGDELEAVKKQIVDKIGDRINRITSYNVCYTKLLRCSSSFSVTSVSTRSADAPGNGVMTIG